MIVLCLVPIAFLVAAVVIGAETPGYSQLHDSISTLALESNMDWQTANFVIGGVLVLALGLVLERSRSDLPACRYVARTTAFFGLVMVLSAVFKTDPNGVKTTHGAIHVLLFVAGVLALLTAQLRFAIRERVRTGFGLYSAGTFLLGLASFIAVLVVSHWQGIAQRVLLAVVFVWVGVAARRCIAARRPTSREPASQTVS